MQTKVKLTKRVVSLATALVTGLSAVGVTGIPGGVFGTLSASAEDGHNYVNGFCTDEGCASPYEPATEENGTYQIANAGNLYWFAEQVNDGNANLNAALTTDIVVNEGNLANYDGTSENTWREWTPIAADYGRYKGTFDGQGHTISGLYFNDSSAECIGIVGDLGRGGVIQNVGLENSYFHVYQYTAGICGYNSGTIRNCYNAGTVIGEFIIIGGIVGAFEVGTVSNCYNTGNITGKSDVGGVCGNNMMRSNTIENCYNTGNITGDMDLGGICGENTANAIIKNCYNIGNVTGTDKRIGGIIGRNASKFVENCYNTGTVTSTGENTDTVGGVCGLNSSNYLTNCYYLADSETDKLDGTTFKTAAEFASGEVAYLLNGSTSGDANIFRQNLDNGEPTDATPVLDSAHDVVYEGMLCTSGTGYTNDEDSTSEIHAWDDNGFCKNDDTHYQPATNNNGTYEISNAGQLYWFADKVNNGTQIVDAILTKDIVVNKGDVAGCDGTKTEGWRDWTPINGTYYISTFDGQGHVIRGLYFNDTSVGNIGLFSHLYKDGKIQNVGLENSYFRGATDIVGICADNAGTIENCYSAGTISAMYGHVGGLVSNNFGSVINCYNTGNITADDRTGGGVVAWNRSGGTIKNCYSTGTLTGGDMNGVVQDNDGTIKNCYYLSDSETDSFDETTAKTAEQFASGEVCYLLNGGKSDETVAFYQTIGEDDYPVLDSTHKVVYADTDCDGSALNYTNGSDVSQSDHDWDDNGFCKNYPTHYQKPEEVNGVYQIANAGQLYWFAAYVNTYDYDNATYPNVAANAVLTADITVNEGDVAGCDGTKAEGWRVWTPIAPNTATYAGKFDGQGHTISGLYFNNEDIDDGKYVGLFGHMENGGEIQNVGLKNSYFRGRNYIGGICGSNYKTGTIRNCYSEANVTGVVVGADIGGVVGENNGTVENCYNTGNVVGNKWVGGVCGYNDGTNNNCYNTGKVTGTSYVGDVCGQNDKGTLTNCYYLADSETNNNDGTFGKTAEQFASGEVAYLLNGSESTDVAFCQNLDNGEPTDATPVLDSTHGTVYQFTNCNHADTYTNNKDAKSGDHSWDDNGFCRYNDSHYAEPEQVNGVYQIENAGQLYWFAAFVNTEENGTYPNTSANAVLTKDIVVNENVLNEDGTLNTSGTFREWIPIGDYISRYAGKFNGQNHTVSGLYYDDSGYAGLFSMMNDGTILNVGVVDSYLKSSSVSGAICAWNNGTIENCYNSGRIYGKEDCGGISGFNGGIIKNCYNTGTLEGGMDGTLNGVGGICGYNDETIENCHSVGKIENAVGYIGGVCALNFKVIRNCYFNSDIYTGNRIGYESSVGTIENVEGKTTAEFASGEVCYLLNGDQSAIAFYQDLSSEKYPTLNADSEQVCRLEMTYDESFGEDAATVTTYHNTGAKITLEKSPDNAYTYHYYVGETEITESPYTLTADTEIIVKKVPVEIQLSEGISDTIELTYHKKMDALDLNDFVTNLDVLESVDFQVDAASALPEGLTLTAEGVLSGTPEKATDKVKTTLILTAKNGASKKAELTFHIAKADPTVEVTVDGDKHTEGDPVDELGLILSDNSTKGTVKIVGEIKRLAAGKNTLTWEFTPADSDNYNVVTGTVIVNAQATTTTTVTTTKATTVITSGTTSTTKASTATSRTTSATKASTATSGATSTTKASATTNGTTSTTKASTATSGTTSATKASVTTNGTTSTTKASVTISGTTSTTKASVTTSGTTSTTKATTVTTSGTTSTTKASTSTSGMTSTTKASATTSGTTSTTKASTTTNGTTSTTKASTTINGTTSTTKASVTTSGTTSTTKASTTASGTTSMTKVSTTTSGTTFTTKASTTTSGTTFTTKASTTTSGTTSTTTTATTSATATTTTTVTTSITTASATTTSTTTTSATSSTTNTTTTTTTASTTSSETTTTTSTTSGTTETSETTSTTETGTSTSTSSSDTPEGQISVTISTESVYCTAEDSTPFDLASFMSVSLVNAAGETVDVTADVTLEYDSPAALFAARNTAYVAENLKATYTAENGEVYEITGPMVYIGKKGDANLDGKVDSTDIYELMRYIAYVGAGFSDTKLLETSPDAADENLSVLAYFLADADTESTEGKNTAEKRLDPQDMFYVMYYVANRGAGVPVTWSDIIR